MKINIRECDDWVAVYKDGKKVWENHSCSLKDGLDSLGIYFEHVYFEFSEMNEWGDLLKDGSDPFPEEIDG